MLLSQSALDYLNHVDASFFLVCGSVDFLSLHTHFLLVLNMLHYIV